MQANSTRHTRHLLKFSQLSIVSGPFLDEMAVQKVIWSLVASHFFRNRVVITVCRKIVRTISCRGIFSLEFWVSEASIWFHLMGSRARNGIKVLPESDSFGIIPKKSKTTNFAVILRLTHDLSVLEKLNVASLFLEILYLPTIRLSCFLDQFYIYFQR